MEIIVVDGGSNDGTCDWLAKQKDIFTIIQPNFRIIDQQGISILSHSWGEFINIGFKYSSSPWVVMVSDDLILTEGALQKGYYLLNERVKSGEKIGGRSIFLFVNIQDKTSTELVCYRGTLLILIMVFIIKKH